MKLMMDLQSPPCLLLAKQVPHPQERPVTSLSKAIMYAPAPKRYLARGQIDGEAREGPTVLFTPIDGVRSLHLGPVINIRSWDEWELPASAQHQDQNQHSRPTMRQSASINTYEKITPLSSATVSRIRVLPSADSKALQWWNAKNGVVS